MNSLNYYSSKRLTCPFCKHRINKKNGNHIYNCNSNTKLKNKKDIKFTCISFNYPYLSDKNNLYNEYVLGPKSLPDLKKEYGIDYKNIIFLLDYFGIIKRDIKKSQRLITSKKYKKTCLEKYGTTNVSSLSFVKKKKLEAKNRIVKSENLNQLKDCYEWLQNNILNAKDYIGSFPDNAVQKELHSLYKKYKKHWMNLTDEQKYLLVGTETKLETRISETLDKLNLNYDKYYKIGENIYDFRIHNTNILIDVIGDVWGGNPVFYKENDTINYFFEKMKVSTMWKQNEKRKKIAMEKKFKLIIIWEFDINGLEENQLINLLISKINELSI